MICIEPIMSTKSQYTEAEMGGMFVSLRVQYATVKCVFSLAWNVDSELALRNLQCHSRRSEPPRRTLAWLSQCVSTAQRDAERRRTEETLSSIILYAVGVRRCIRRNGSRQSLMRDDRYFVLDALLDRQPVKRL